MLNAGRVIIPHVNSK